MFPIRMLVSLTLFSLGAALGIYLAVHFWLDPFERSVWSIFWQSITHIHVQHGSKLPMPEISDILTSSLFYKLSISSLAGGLLFPFLLRKLLRSW